MVTWILATGLADWEWWQPLTALNLQGRSCDHHRVHHSEQHLVVSGIHQVGAGSHCCLDC